MTQCDTGEVTVVTSVLELNIAFSSITNLTSFTASIQLAIAAACVPSPRIVKIELEHN